MGRWILGLDVGGKEMDLPELPSQAGEGNRTLVSSLEGYSFTIKLHPRARNVTRLPDTASAFSPRSLLEKVGPGH